MDILTAMTLCSILVVALLESSVQTKAIFTLARLKNEILNEFASATPTYIKKYANDFEESNILGYISVSSSTQARSAAQPICSADFYRSNPLGSYSRETFPQVHIDRIDLPISPQIPLTDLEVRNSIAYVSADSNTASDPDLFVFGLNSGALPVLLSSINTGPGLSAITLKGKRIYASAASTAAQLHIIKIDTLSSLSLEKKYQLPLPYATASPPFGTTVTFESDRLFLGTEKWDGQEFNVVNISNPLYPSVVGGQEIGSKVNHIYVQDNIAYVSSADQKQLMVFDIEKNQPSEYSAFSPNGFQRQEGEAVNIFEDTVLFGRTSGGFDIKNEYEFFLFASTSSTSLSVFSQANIPGGVYGMVADRYHVYLVSREPGKEFRIYSDLASSTAFSLPLAPQTLTCDNNHIYILSHTSPTLLDVTFKP